MTRFQILAKDDTGAWKERGTEEAHNAEQAVKASYLKKPDGAVVAMVAVPQRSWRPTPIRLEQTQRVVLGQVADEPENP